ncbi:peptidoglycan DD-metalloendopeptidase family protein [Adhaeribacter swui]|uniref:Peptidoglycan DD-metalloendopeptidase family protein n=1 Tax=Adhaeribacter swui TaxID=2086471 RepID=A0A7G7GCI9_9BACT|nr:peptidoglycan DD-metalloendopeptidase family protein [Adhaeribacter swui]QNF34873.1 peptidoglycan DD-metalloendopeptidase family protein [Adhaeribacter swui]
MNTLPDAVLAELSSLAGPVVPIDLNSDLVCRLDFTAQNTLLSDYNLENTVSFDALIEQMLQQKNARVGIGGYLENRVIYRRSRLFDQTNTNRSIHLGVDIWAEAGTPVLAPLAATVHSFQDNAQFGDYGPTIILEHQLPDFKFFTLYGHLSRSSLHDLHVGKIFNKGEQVGFIGDFPENGDWPPHLHFQLITDMMSQTGDFPGVCSPNEKTMYAQLCPDPNLLLQCRHLTAF